MTNMYEKYENSEIIEKHCIISSKLIENGNNRRETFFPKLINELNFKKGAEIGVDKGDFSYCLLDNTTIENFYCIDPWIDNFGSDHRPGYFDPNGKNRMKDAENKLSSFSNKTTFIKDYSMNAYSKFDDSSLDFVYIDGDHSLEVFFDIYAWFSKVRLGGIISGHDYKDGRNSGMKDYWGNQMDYKVKTSVDYFCSRYGLQLNLVGGHVPSWWITKNRDTI